MRDLFPVMERLVTDSFRAVNRKIDPFRNSHAFEIFGYDFMIDENFKVLMIEANTNPCLEICCPLLARIIPELLDNTFRIAVDPLYQPSALITEDKPDDLQKQSTKSRRKFDLLQQIKFTLIFDD
jgi:tubulin monoglycylase TTLL3/8